MRPAALALALALAAALAGPAAAQPQRTPQQQISESQRRLQQIREEREELRRDLRTIRGQVNSVSAEIRNIQRQATVSASLLRELELQLEATQLQILDTETELAATQAQLTLKRELLDRRVRDIYKRGPLQAVEVLLSAQSFSDLINRYKYLYLVARRDRRLVREVGELHRQLALREQELKRSYAEIQYLQAERAQEHGQLESLRTNRSRTLTTLRTHERA
ncbi:MAG TPA: hypothetical protein VFX98_11630, partial [Longimicrobiaceae bacterium]|nr:hypothetical protein [Longimicrobiaceae bacterium]